MDANIYRYHDAPNFSIVTFAALRDRVLPHVNSSRNGRLRAPRRLKEKYPMNWDRVEGNWKQMKGKAREQWGKLTDSDWDQIAGKRDQLVGRIQERYGISKDEAQKQADAWARTQSEEAREPQEHGVRR
jgi:uncharacterized protein YjbJ (UPF0337 family)